MSMNPTHQPLLQILYEARALLERPGNDFAWSSWADAATATAQLEGYIESIERGRLPPRLDLQFVFAPTGRMQEVSISSGWGAQFIALAERFDAAAARLWS